MNDDPFAGSLSDPNQNNCAQAKCGADWASMKIAVLVLSAALSAVAQTNPVAGGNPSNPADAHFTDGQQHVEKIRADCIAGRRFICGKILNVFPDGLVVESGYTNLFRQPLTSSWLVLGKVTAIRAVNLVESAEPGSVCLGTVYLTDYPKSKKLKPKRYDYVIIEGYPAGQCTYTSLGTIHKTARRFSAQLAEAVELNLQAEQKAPSPMVGAR
jgi:hypothetical protein